METLLARPKPRVESEGRPSRPRRITPIAFLAVVFLVALGFWPMRRGKPEDPQIRPMRHLKLREEVHEWLRLASDVRDARKDEQRERMDLAVQYLAERIRPLMENEERMLFSLVDEHAPDAARRAVALLRSEHEVIGRWIEELERRAYEAVPDGRAFYRLCSRLAWLLETHLEEEARILETLDGKASGEEFWKRFRSRWEGLE